MRTPTSLRRLAPALVAALTLVAACDEGDAPFEPAVATVTVGQASVSFGDQEVELGSTGPRTVTLTNTGTLSVLLGSARLVGSGAADFGIRAAPSGTTLAPGASVDVAVTFDPSDEGAREAALEIDTDAAGTLSVGLVGTGARFTYRQVDRVGIPALNTVFNHPPQFSKTDYNTASPADDVATYTGLFETVLGAVANPDPSATAALLLPDELPVSLGASATSFAQLTGRAPADDAVDVALSVVVGVESLQSDNVDANDRAFPLTFPYLAGPN